MYVFFLSISHSPITKEQRQSMNSGHDKSFVDATENLFETHSVRGCA